MSKIKKKDRPYSVVPYNQEWAERYEKEKNIIASIIKEKANSIEHVGSTSIEGMWAKPQIDILVIVEDLNLIDGLITQMESKGYIFQKDYNKYDERYFVRDAPSGERLTGIHIMQSNHPQALSHIYLREYLRQHPQDRELYSQAKREAYEGGVDRAEYPKRKNEVLNKILERAKKWHYENNR